MNTCKVIAIENQKGGTGKSTTALNLGVGLSRAGKSVLLIDSDPQASLTLSLGVVKPDDLKVNLATVMMRIINDHPFDDNYGLLSCEEGVDLMPSSIEHSGIEPQMMSVMSREFVLKTYVDQMRPHYDYILIDCTPSLNMLPVNAFVAADSIIVPSQPRILSTKGLDLLMNSYRCAPARRSLHSLQRHHHAHRHPEGQGPLQLQGLMIFRQADSDCSACRFSRRHR